MAMIASALHHSSSSNVVCISISSPSASGKCFSALVNGSNPAEGILTILCEPISRPLIRLWKAA